MSSTASNRCPRCGNYNRIDSYVCAFCGKRLKEEYIEKLSLFKRIEEEWTSPVPWYKLLLWLFIKPNRAFWNINHKRKSAPGYKIVLFNSLLYGLVGLSFFAHIEILGVPPFSLISLLYGLSVFVAFFLLGLVYYFLFGMVLVWLFIRGANITVDFSKRLETRFSGGEEGEKYSEAEMSPFSIYKGGTLHQQQAYKYKMIMCGFAPFLVSNLINIIIILVAFPTVPVTLTGTIDDAILRPIFNSPTWLLLYLIEALTLIIWIPMLIALAIRELSNSSTFRVYLSSLIIAGIVAVLFFFLRPIFIL